MVIESRVLPVRSVFACICAAREVEWELGGENRRVSQRRRSNMVLPSSRVAPSLDEFRLTEHHENPQRNPSERVTRRWAIWRQASPADFG